MYVLEVDGKIFILDAGLKNPSFDLYGIDAVIPDITHLLENKERIQGIFLSHGHDDFIGAVPELLKEINVGVFGTHFTISLVEHALREAGMNIADYRLYRINHKVLKFGNHRSILFHKPQRTNAGSRSDPDGRLFAPTLSRPTPFPLPSSSGMIERERRCPGPVFEASGQKHGRAATITS